MDTLYNIISNEEEEEVGKFLVIFTVLPVRNINWIVLFFLVLKLVLFYFINMLKRFFLSFIYLFICLFFTSVKIAIVQEQYL